MSERPAIDVEVVGAEELTAELVAAAEALSPDGMVAPMKSATLYITRQAKKNLSKKYGGVGTETGGVNTGRLRNSITPQVKTHMLETVGIVGSNVKYAPFVEYPTRPHYPPIAPLIMWVRRKFGLAGRAMISAAYGVQRAIGKRGTKGILFLTHAFESSTNKIIQIFDRAVKKATEG